MAPVETPVFNWEKFDEEIYTCSEDKRRIFFKGDPTKQYRPVIGDKAMAEGKHYWTVQTTCDNMRVGIATEKCPLDGEAGSNDQSWVVDLQTGDVWHKSADCKAHSIYVPAPEALARLYKLVVPSSGGSVGMKLDLDDGSLQLFFNSEYMGQMIKDPKLKDAGPFRPCVAIGGLEGKCATSPSEAVAVPAMYSYKRNKL